MPPWSIAPGARHASACVHVSARCGAHGTLARGRAPGSSPFALSSAESFDGTARMQRRVVEARRFSPETAPQTLVPVAALPVRNDRAGCANVARRTAARRCAARVAPRATRSARSVARGLSAPGDIYACEPQKSAIASARRRVKRGQAVGWPGSCSTRNARLDGWRRPGAASSIAPAWHRHSRLAREGTSRRSR
jgi:hypothetical protein